MWLPEDCVCPAAVRWKAPGDASCPDAGYTGPELAPSIHAVCALSLRAVQGRGRRVAAPEGGKPSWRFLGVTSAPQLCPWNDRLATFPAGLWGPTPVPGTPGPALAVL